MWKFLNSGYSLKIVDQEKKDCLTRGPHRSWVLCHCFSLTVEINECYPNENERDHLFTVTCRAAQRQAEE